jgi:hypothetical protein
VIDSLGVSQLELLRFGCGLGRVLWVLVLDRAGSRPDKEVRDSVVGSLNTGCLGTVLSGERQLMF